MSNRSFLQVRIALLSQLFIFCDLFTNYTHQNHIQSWHKKGFARPLHKGWQQHMWYVVRLSTANQDGVVCYWILHALMLRRSFPVLGLKCFSKVYNINHPHGVIPSSQQWEKVKECQLHSVIGRAPFTLLKSCGKVERQRSSFCWKGNQTSS